MDVYLEAGATRVFAAALEWPGWCRSARSEQEALEALARYAPRYAAAVASAGFEVPQTPSFTVVERLEGGSATDFGVPGGSPSADAGIDEAELERLERILRAVWKAFGDGVAAARGVRLRTGARGGGRNLAKITDHVCEAEQGYLRMLGGRYTGKGIEPVARLPGVHEAFVEAMRRRARGELPDRGPRGGARWPVRYAARRTAWHTLDHLWEIEDRSEPA
jgi:hypothetical protein